MPTKSEKKEIIRVVNCNGKTFGPGQEDELVEALEAVEDEQEEGGKFDHRKELERLEKIGVIAGFVEVSDEDREDSDADIRATRKRNPHLLADSAPLQKLGAAPQTMEEIQMAPDSNVVDAKMSGGKVPADDSGARADATKEALEERKEAAIQQESEQVQSPEAGSGTEGPKAVAKKKSRKTAKK